MVCVAALQPLPCYNRWYSDESGMVKFTKLTLEDEIEKEKMGSEPQEICRLCAGTFMSVVPIFGNDDLPMKIQNISSLDVKSNDGLPAQVCHQCAQLVNLCYHFKLRCESSDCFFRLSYGCDVDNQKEDDDADDKTAMEAECLQNGSQDSSENDTEEVGSSEQPCSEDPSELEGNREECTSMKPAIPDYLYEPYVPGKPGKKPNFPVDKVAELLQEYKEVILTKDGQIQPKAAPCWQFLCELLNNMLEGIYSTSANNIYTYVKCNRYNLQSYLGIDTERKHKVGRTEANPSSESYNEDNSGGESDEVKNLDHDYHMSEGEDTKTVRFVINLSEEEWQRMSLELTYGESFLNRQGWSHINRLFKVATEAKCRMAYSSVVEAGKDGACLSLSGKCGFCDSTLSGHISCKDLLPGQNVPIYCTYVGTFHLPHPGINEQRGLIKEEELSD